MDLPAIIKAVLAPRTERSSQTVPNFRAGARLVGKVLQVERDGRVLVDLGGTRVLARMGIDVSQGQSLKLTVVDMGPPLHLRADSPADPGKQAPVIGSERPADLPSGLTEDERRELRNTLKILLPRLTARASTPSVARGVINALHQIKAAVDPLPLDRPAAEIAQWLRRALEDHGGLFEKRLADIEKGIVVPRADIEMAAREAETAVRAVITRDVKPQLMILKNFFNSADGDPATALKLDARQHAQLSTSIEKMLQHLDQQQERVMTRTGEGEPFQMFSHSLPIEERRPPVQLKVFYPREGSREGDRTSHRIALLLDMDQLGWVRGDIAQTADGLQIRFYVRDRDVQNLFNARSHEIAAALKDHFDRVQVEVSVATDKIAQFHHEDVPGAVPGRIDIKA